VDKGTTLTRTQNPTLSLKELQDLKYRTESKLLLREAWLLMSERLGTNSFKVACGKLMQPQNSAENVQAALDCTGYTGSQEARYDVPATMSILGAIVKGYLEAALAAAVEKEISLTNKGR
jgi:hypothetical protein